ncbi:hypothetical protein B0O99DRAFT_696679 [Bisporella sp. PMI_857]|nr:hypothetical protein B0O99DRAFT_696679 [Bisporella sp. PMI_857]
MKIPTILAALSAILASKVQGVAATCYKSGDTWPNLETAYRFVAEACYNNGGMFTGYYSPGQTKAMCPRDGGIGLVFEVQNLNNDGFDLGDDDCLLRLKNEILACSHGGESTVAGWRFRADPGNC